MADNISNPPILEHRRISLPSGEVNIIIVYPNKDITSPAEFTDKCRDKHNISSDWIRSAHETIPANSRHIPVLFCGAARYQANTIKPESALPSNPSHIKQFIGRLEPVKHIFSWLKDRQEPRAFLYGRGGSGKTTIAYEVARVLAEYGGNIDMDGGDKVDQVIFVSSKNTFLDTSRNKQDEFVSSDFDTAENLLRAILTLGGWTSSADLGQMNFSELVTELQAFFDTASCFIVVDDIDTLTTNGVDAGFDQIYRALIRARRPSKVLYTQRNAPSQSLMNSIEVPGLSLTGEYQKFVEVCCTQFGVDEPTVEFRDGRLALVTERRPLVLETVLALRRNSGSFERAVTLFEENVGTDARSYVFGREWDALSGDNSRQLLCALALYGRPLSFTDIRTILRYDDTRIFDAINDTREMFLERNEIGEETLYSLGDLTRAFVLERSKGLDRFSAVEARVNSFKRSFFPELPELSRLMQTCDNLIRLSSRLNDPLHLVRAYRHLNEDNLAAKITEDPRFRAFRGYVGTKQSPVPIGLVRDDFDFALSMKYEPPADHLLAWFVCEESSGEASKHCIGITEFVERGRSYSAEEKVSFLARRSGFFYQRAKERRYFDMDGAISDSITSLNIHAEVFFRSININSPQEYKYDKYYTNTSLFFFNICRQNNHLDGIIDCIISISLKQNVYLDPIIDAVNTYLPSFELAANGRSSKARLKGRVTHLMKAISNDRLWQSLQVRDSVVSSFSSLIIER